MSEIDTIQIDMDGVLVDLDKTLAAIDGFTCPLAWFRREFTGITENSIRDFYYNKIKVSLEDRKVFEEAEPMADFMQMFSFILRLKSNGYQVNILSSKMKNELSDEVYRQKMIWLERQNLTKIVDNIYIVNGQEDKVNYSSANSLLIDDLQFTCDLMSKAGFKTINHRSATQTIKEFGALYKLV